MTERSRFDRGLTVNRAVRELEAEVARWGGTDLSVVPDGLVGRDLVQREDLKPGCTISFTTAEGKQFTRHSGHYDRLQCNVWAFVKTLDALRGVDRWGCTTAEASLASLMLDQPHTDALLLPAGATMPKTLRDAAQILEVDINCDVATVKASFRAKAKRLHPDLVSGHGDHMAALNAAKRIMDEEAERRG